MVVRLIVDELVENIYNYIRLFGEETIIQIISPVIMEIYRYDLHVS